MSVSPKLHSLRIESNGGLHPRALVVAWRASLKAPRFGSVAGLGRPAVETSVSGVYVSGVGAPDHVANRGG